jgi:hypothetical protein
MRQQRLVRTLGSACKSALGVLLALAAVARHTARALPCHHGGPCIGRNSTPPHLMPRLHNVPSCLQTSGPHDMAATITLAHEDGGVIHHVFQFCIPCLYTSPEQTCFFKNGATNPNAANGTWRVNNVGDAWQCVCPRIQSCSIIPLQSLADIADGHAHTVQSCNQPRSSDVDKPWEPDRHVLWLRASQRERTGVCWSALRQCLVWCRRD